MKKLHVLTGIASATLMSYGLVAQAANSVTVSMPTNSGESAYNITLTGHSGNSWTYNVAWVKGKTLSHWDLALGSCSGHVINNYRLKTVVWKGRERGIKTKVI